MGATPNTHPSVGGKCATLNRQEITGSLSHPLAADPFIGLAVIFIPALPDICPLGQKEVLQMDVRIYVGNLNKSTTQAEINTLFATAGTVSSVEVAMDKGTGKSKGFAFVSMPTQEEADKAISMFNDHFMGDNMLKVNVAKPRVA